MKVKLEYIWLDGYKPEPNLRSKTKVWDFDPLTTPKHHVKRELSLNGTIIPTPDELPDWSFDGSSTQQAEGSDSDCILNPVRVISDPQRHDGFLVLCEVLNPDGNPHPSNSRHLLDDDEDVWFGFEQEYTLMSDTKPLGFPTTGYPEPQGQYYCGVGLDNVVGRDIAEEHLEVCIQAKLDVTGINAEVMLGQWEYQLFSRGAKKASDDLWLSRYLLYRISEKYNVKIELHPKPVKGDWNGSGMHCNFSNFKMRNDGGADLFMDICEKFKKNHKKNIKEYGSNNNQRLTGLHETQSIKKFSYGVSDRGASIRIPIKTHLDQKGYLEDRRPASNADPYKVSKVILENII